MLRRRRPSLPTPTLRLRWIAAATALLLPTGAALAVAQVPATAPAARSIDGAATAAKISWTPPSTILEDQRFSLGLKGEINGQATGHIAMLDAGTACPSSPLYPRQIAVGTRLTIAPDPAAVVPTPTPVPPAATVDTTPTTPATPAPTVAPSPSPTLAPTPVATPSATPAPTITTPAPLGGLVDQTLTFTEKDSGSFHLCGWVVASPATSEASTVARIDQPVSVGNRASTVAVELPDTARSGDYFTMKATGTTPGAGRRLLIMAEPDKGQRCETLHKAAAGKRPLQSIVGIPSGSFTKTVKLRYRTKTAGTYLLCVQVVEATDRNPEGAASKTMQVTESIKCVNTQAAITARRRDLEVIRGRRDAAQERLSAARKKLAPLRAKYSKAKRASDRRIATARKAVSKAKSAAGKKRARKRLASVRRTEAARLKRAGAPLRKANATIKVQERTYRQYRTGANLLNDTIARMKKDTKKYCAKPVV